MTTKSSLQSFDKLFKWKDFRKNFLWGTPGPATGHEETYQAQRDAVLGYMLRQLGRGYIPDPQLIIDTFNGMLPIPTCGYIGCLMDEGHCH